MMQKSQFLGIFFYTLLVGVLLGSIGCGGSNLSNPVSEAESLNDVETAEAVGNLDVRVTVTKKTVEPGEEVEITASVNGVRGTSVTLNWLNITNYGELSEPIEGENSILWTAPSSESLNGANVQVEVIQLIVTVITEVVSVGTSGIDTDTQILSETKTVLLTTVDDRD